MNTPLILVAASGLAREVISVCRSTGHGKSSWEGRSLLGFLDDDAAKLDTMIAGLPVLGGLEVVSDYPEAELVICAGMGTARRSIASRLAARGFHAEQYATVVDPSVDVPNSCVVGKGSILLAGTVLTADVTVGEHVVCMPHVTLTHDDILADFVTLAAGVTLGGGVHIGEAAYLGMNSAVRERLTIGPGAILGMGSALVADQPADSVWAGVPARYLTFGANS